jgi:two-component system chemotaxis response regulator CheB
MFVRYLGFVIALLTMFQIGTADQSGDILAEDHISRQAASAEAEHGSEPHEDVDAEAQAPDPSSRLFAEPARLEATSGGMGLLDYFLVGAVGFLLLAAWVWKSGALDNSRIAGKLYCGFAAAALLTLSVGAINVASLSQTSAKGVLQTSATNLNVLIVQAHVLHDRFLLIGVGDEEHGKKLLAKHHEVIGEFRAELETFQTRKLDAVDRRTANQIARLTRKYEKSFAARATTYQGIDEFQGRFVRLGESIANGDLINGTEELTEIELQVSALAMKALEAQLEEQSTASMSVLSVIGLALVLGCLVAWQTASAIIKPLLCMLNTLQDIGTSEENVHALKTHLQPKIEAFARSLHVRRLLRGEAILAPGKVATAAPSQADNMPRRMEVSGPPVAEVVAVGISTGGPQALGHFLPQLPADLGAPVLIVQHMPPYFTASLASDLDRRCGLKVSEAVDGQSVTAGHVLIAPGGKQMKVVKNGPGTKIRITDDPPENSCCPSVDYLFRSVTRVYGGNAVGVIMTGMGNDGALGCKQMKQRGAAIIAQDEASCVVFGMPKEPVETGIVDVVVPLNEIAAEITSRVPHQVVL